MVWIGNQPASTYNALIYYPGELYNYGSVVGGAQPGASLTMTTTGITATAAAGSTYTATIEYANASWSSSAVNPSANVALNILANGVVVGTGALSGLAQNSPWTAVTASWVAQAADAGQTIQLQVVATNFLEGPGSNDPWQVPTIGFTNATLTATAPPTAPSGLTATAISSSQINLSWTVNVANQTGFQIDQATSSDFTAGLTTATVGADATTYSATGLSSDTTYYYRVRSTTAVGDSANTSTASATTGFLRTTGCRSRARRRFFCGCARLLRQLEFRRRHFHIADNGHVQGLDDYCRAERGQRRKLRMGAGRRRR